LTLGAPRAYVAAMRRRELLRLVAVVAGTALVPGRRARVHGRAAAPPADEARLAALGARLAAADPARARALAREVEARVRRVGRRAAGATLLGRRARERDVARGDLLPVDGWLLTRSEVAWCAYLHASGRASAGGRGRTELG
jgi:hypothetical protein